MEGQNKKRRGRPVGSLGKKRREAMQQGREASLPPPVEPGEPAAEPERSGGLLDGVRSLFQSQTKPQAAETPAEKTPSENSSVPSSAYDPLSEEAAHLLASVPDAIGGSVDEDAAAVPGATESQEDPIAALMAQVAFEPQDVQDVLGEFFDWLAERAESDHWKLTERQGRMLARPLAQLLNSAWIKLQAYLPEVLGRWCESTPGAMAFLTAAGLVIGPKVAKQMQISRARRKVVPLVKDRKPAPVESAPLPRRPEGGGIVFETAQ